MREKIGEILEKQGIKTFGFCDFSLLKNCLLNCKAKERLPKNSKSVITVLFPYKVNIKKPKNISRYSAVLDYHILCLDILKNAVLKLNEIYPENVFEPFVDNSPINEVRAGVFCGLGVRGKNGLLINEKYGSFCFIGEIVTDLEISSEVLKNQDCIGCNICLEKCPTGFLRDKNKKCLSALTQQKGNLTDEERQLILKNNTVWGCDICQEVCPLNKDKSLTDIKGFLESYRDEYKKGEDIEKRAYAWRGEKVILRNAEILEENQ